MKRVPLDSLKNKIIQPPGFEAQLKPLIMYRGSLSLGRAHRWWNVLISAMEHEATDSDVTQRLLMNSEYSQLCGLENKVNHMGLRSFVGRLEDNPQVLALVPHLKEYIGDLLPHYKGGICPSRISEITHSRRNMGAGGWRIYEGLRKKRAPGSNLRESSAAIVYPFLIHDGGRPEHDLLKRVNAAVPRHFPPEMRADICQDIIVGILCGDFPEDNLTLPAKEMTKRVQRMFPTKYGPLSLDAEIPGTDGFRLIDTISEEDSLWARI